MSVSMTLDAVKRQEKTVTRRHQAGQDAAGGTEER